MGIEIEKVRNIAVYLSEKIDNLYFTKFLKLLYYLDFIAVQETGTPITNDTYFALPYGPIPSYIKDNVNLLDTASRASEIGLLTADDITPQEDRGIFDGFIQLRKNTGTIIEKSAKDFDPTKLSVYEKKLLDDIIGQFGKVSTKDIVNMTHQEAPYSNTAPNNKIDYRLAFQLNIKNILPNRDFVFDKDISLSRFDSI